MRKAEIPKDAKLVFEGKIYEVYQWPQKMFDGSIATFERLKRPDTVQVIPILPNRQILLLDEEQPGRKPFIGLPGGRVDAGEEPLTAAKRELREETGYEAKNWVPWLSYWPQSHMVWTIHYYVAHDLVKAGEPETEPGEKISEKPISFETFINIPEDPKFVDFRSGGLFIEELVRAKYDPKKRQELERLFFS